MEEMFSVRSVTKFGEVELIESKPIFVKLTVNLVFVAVV
jgi:hypothetical protein